MLLPVMLLLLEWSASEIGVVAFYPGWAVTNCYVGLGV
jgi:hypothetical protein